MIRSPAFVLIVLSILLYAGQAHAYLDPGTGSIILQGLIAAALAVAVTGGIYWRRLKDFLARFTKEKDDNNGTSHES